MTVSLVLGSTLIRACGTALVTKLNRFLTGCLYFVYFGPSQPETNPGSFLST